jgi:glucose-1-phosphate thymidylyltransferase
MIRALFGNGSTLGLNLSYAEQPQPEGIAQAFLIAEEFLGGAGAALVLGDNIFHGKLDFFRNALAQESGACIFACPVRDPERYGVIEFDADGRALSIEEKPAKPKSPYAVPGLYVYDERIVAIAKALTPSRRGELEITDVNKRYMADGALRVEAIGRGVAWLDTGTPASLLEASNYIATLEHRQGVKVACIEEIAYEMGFIDRAGLDAIINALPKNEYCDYLAAVAAERPGLLP